jgi:nucleotide-binding universal stress UspA family protein
MSPAVILAVVSGGTQGRVVLDAAATLGARLHAHIRVLHVLPDASRVVLFTGVDTAIATAEIIGLAQREAEANAARARAVFDAWYPAARRKIASVPSGSCCIGTTEWVERVGDPAAVTAEAAQVADVSILAAPRGAEDTGLLETVLFDAGRPVLVVPPRKLPADLFAHALVAWKPGREAARAVAASLPILSSSRRVSVFAAPESTDAPAPSVEIIPYLAWHSVNAELVGPSAEDVPVGEKLLEAADRQGASLVVLGAYAHSRLRELVLGGVTRHVLRHAPLPLLMAH